MNRQSPLESRRPLMKEREVFRKSHAWTLRTIVLSHRYRHHGQLSLYVQLLDISVLAVYERSGAQRAPGR